MNEDLNSFILSANPDRWKILQALKIDGQNDKFQNEFEISDAQFKHFLNKNKEACNKLKVAVEDVNLIKGSYLMISPEGKLYDNTGHKYIYSDLIMDIGLDEALKQINFDKSKFILRGGYYDYENNLKNGKESVAA